MREDRCLVLTGYDDRMVEIGALTQSNHEAYARRHGYGFEAVRKYDVGTHPSWQKLEKIRERLPGYDAVLWIDADAFVTNPDFQFHSLIGDKKGLIFSRDWNNDGSAWYFSAGVFIAVSCRETTEIMEEAMKKTHWANRLLWDQSALQEVCKKSPRLADFVHVLPRRVLNAVPDEIRGRPVEPWEPGDFICHLTCIDNARRKVLFGRRNPFLGL